MIVVGFGFGGLFAAGVVLSPRSERKVSPGRIKSARRMLCCSDFSLSRVRGVFEWISLLLVFRLFTGFLPVDIL